jgi:hypothetical protein
MCHNNNNKQYSKIILFRKGKLFHFTVKIRVHTWNIKTLEFSYFQLVVGKTVNGEVFQATTLKRNVKKE